MLASDRRTFHLKSSLYLAKLLVSPREDGGVQNHPLLSSHHPGFFIALLASKHRRRPAPRAVGTASQGKVLCRRSALSHQKCFGRASRYYRKGICFNPI